MSLASYNTLKAASSAKCSSMDGHSKEQLPTPATVLEPPPSVPAALSLSTKKKQQTEDTFAWQVENLNMNHYHLEVDTEDGDGSLG
jgi:hypothetical protein